MKNYRYFGFLICFLLLTTRNAVAQAPDFSKMTRQQQQEYIKKMQQQQERLKQQLLKKFSETPGIQKEKMKTGSVFINFKRTVTHNYNETKTVNGTVNTQSGNSTININVNLSSAQVIESDEGAFFSVTAYGDQQPGGIPLNGSGELSAEEEGQTDHSNSKSKGSISLDLANTQVSFNYNKESKQGQLNLSAAYFNPRGSASVHYVSNEYPGGDISSAYIPLLKIMGTTYGNLGAYTYDVMEQAYKNMTPDQIQQYHNGMDMGGNGGICTVSQTKKGYEISYINTATSAKVDDGWTGTNTYTVSTQVHVSIGEKPTSLEAVIEPLDLDAYHKWLPEGPDPKDEKTTGNNISFTVYTKDKTKPDQKITANIKSVIYTLTNVSREPGYSMNYPSVKPNTKADLQLLAINEKPDPEVEKLNLKLNADKGRDVNVACFDYGAYGRITALVTLTDGTVLVAKGDKGQKNYATIPYCTHDDSKVADYWKELHKATGLKDDDDSETDDNLENNTYKGDGFSLYEEYRGFIEKKIHIRTDPHKKDVMICDKVRDALATAANALPSGSAFEKAQKLALPHRSQDGINMFAAVTGFITHSKFEPDEFGIDIGKNIYAGNIELDTINLPPFTHNKVLNFNTSGYASLHEQSGLLLLPSPKHLGYAAAFRKDHKSIMPPKGWYCLVITADFDPTSKGYSAVTGDRDILNKKHKVAVNPNGGAKIITDEYAVTVAHEMLHYCNVKHHGDLDEGKINFYIAPGYPSVYIVENSVSVPIKFFWDDSKVTPITPQDPIFKGVTRITVALKLQHGTNSGMEDCIMRYDDGRTYKGPDGNYYLLLDWKKQYSELTGITLCKSNKGTGVNDPNHAPRPRYGDATVGNCQGQVCINDKYIK
jgi:hypothetical protein